jgi:NADPH:quinone reductase-like Zn-dependent oxidoreductase
MRRALATSYGGPAALTIARGAPVPRPSGNELQIRVLASSINPIDVWMTRGYGHNLFPWAGVEPPFTPGRDIVGEVVGLGPLAWNYVVGDMVAAATHPTACGSHADFAVCAETAVARLPADVDICVVAAVPFASLTAWKALNGHAAVHSGQTALVHGAAGSVGAFATQYLTHLGCRVIATCKPGEQEERVRALGADTVLDLDSFMARTTGAGAGASLVTEDSELAADLVLDCVGKAAGGGAVQAHSLRVLQPGGHYCDLNGDFIRCVDSSGLLQGLPSAAVALASHQAKLRSDTGHEYSWVLFEENGSALAEVLRLVEVGVVKPSAVPSTLYDFEDIGRAYEDVESRSVHKAVILSDIDNIGSN